MNVVLHVGLPKTGTTYLQGVLAANRERLAGQGVLYPFLASGAHFRAAVEIRGSAGKFGLDGASIAGTWRALCDQARAFDGVTILGHEILAGATPAQIAATLEPLAGLEVTILATARDLGRQATAHWQEEVKLGHTGSFADFERDQLRADTGRDLGPDAGGDRPHFWHAQDWSDALRRWTVQLGPANGRLVIAPRPGAPPEELWRRFCAAAGVTAIALPEDSGESVNASLASADIALLRAVNQVVGDRLDRAERNRIVKRQWAEGELSRRAGDRPRAPYYLASLFGGVTQRWSEEVREAGYVVTGDLAELAPVTGDPTDPSPDVPIRDGDDPLLIARSLLGTGRPEGGRWGRLRGRRA